LSSFLAYKKDKRVLKSPPKATVKAKKKKAAVPHRRLQAVIRERRILDEAVKFFAEKGFSGKTRELASRLNITQPLLYRYFPTKQHLIEKVFDEVYLNRINPEWSTLLTDRSRPLQDRLCEFYRAYSEVTYRYEWIRIYMFSALMGEPLNRRYIKLVEKKLLTPICNELRDYCGLPDVKKNPVSQLELDHVWVMHGGLFYYAIRKHIYHGRVSKDFSAIVSRAVATMLEGTKSLTTDKKSND
jgi:AcrR family transcriptional regulator